MAKLFGKRGKGRRGEPPPQPFDPRSSFAAAPVPRHARPPASSTPLADQLNRGGPGVTEGYVVLPRSLAEQMPLPWQQQAANVLAQFHQTHQHLEWPRYRVLPSREERLVDLDEEQLAEAGYVVEMDAAGELVYRERNGRKVEHPEQKKVLVTCLDPVQPSRPVTSPGVPRGQQGAAPINIGPQPVWDVVPSKAHQEAAFPQRIAPANPPDHSPPDSAPFEPPMRWEPSGAAPEHSPQRPRVESETSTPPRGIAVSPTQSQLDEAPGDPANGAKPQAQEEVDWFAEQSPSTVGCFGTGVDPSTEEPQASFGPTGEPLERPYRYDQ